MGQNTVLTQGTTIIASFITIAASILATYLYQKYKKQNIPKEWKPVGLVHKLCIYPLKSAKRIEVDQAECTTRGLREMEKTDKSLRLRDRSFVLYHMENFEYRNARQHPKMILIQVKAHDMNSVMFSAPDTEPLILTLPDKKKNSEVVIKHYKKEEIYSIDCGDEAAKWMSQYILGKDSGLRMAYHDGTYKRTQINKLYKDQIDFYKRGLRNKSGGLNSDLTALHIINRASVLDINRRMGNSDVTIDNFRPNLVVDDSNLKAFEEDDWEWIKVGDVVLKNVVECVRCVISTTNAETGARHQDREPLRTMGKFRMSKGPEKGPVMGILLEVFHTGVISVGDTVFIGKKS